MKKLVLIVLTVMLVAGTVGAQQSEWYITATENGRRAANNRVTLTRGENTLFVYFPKREVNFDRIRINFTVDREVEVSWLAVHQDDAVIGGVELIGVMNSGPIETNFSPFNQAWYVGEWGQDTVDTSTIRCVVLRINDSAGRSNFTLTNVEFIGLQQ
jgi:hypothetical protein